MIFAVNSMLKRDHQLAGMMESFDKFQGLVVVFKTEKPLKRF